MSSLPRIREYCSVHQAKAPGCDDCRQYGIAYDSAYSKLVYLNRRGRLRYPAQGAMRRLQALQRLGHSLSQIALAGGTSRYTIKWVVQGRLDTVSEKTHLAVLKAARELKDKPGQGPASLKIATESLAKGWASFEAWNDIDNDDAPIDLVKESELKETEYIRQEVAFLREWTDLTYVQIAERLGVRVERVYGALGATVVMANRAALAGKGVE